MGKLTRRELIRSACIGAVGAVGTGAFQWTSADRLELNHQTLLLPKWDADGVRVALIADLHTDSKAQGELARSAVNMAIRAKPDIIVMAGDYVSLDHPDSFEALRYALEPISGCGIPAFATLGNHDHCCRPKRVIRALKASGVRFLSNEKAEYDGVVIAGIEDGCFGTDRHDFLAARDDGRSIIAIFHEPDFCERVDKRISLMLSGHSHGGQVCLPFGIPVHTPVGARKYVAGYYPGALVPLFVSRGVGTTGFRLRLFCPPEVSILTLRRGES